MGPNNSNINKDYHEFQRLNKYLIAPLYAVGTQGHYP